MFIRAFKYLKTEIPLNNHSSGIFLVGVAKRHLLPNIES